jgi:hypothetical protein
MLKYTIMTKVCAVRTDDLEISLQYEDTCHVETLFACHLIIGFAEAPDEKSPIKCVDMRWRGWPPLLVKEHISVVT